MVLCKNRPEGFGPHSDLHPRLPTTCFLDVIVEPLATWIYLALMLALLPVTVATILRRRRSNPSYAFRPDEEAEEDEEKPEGQRRRNRQNNNNKSPPGILSRVLSTIYYLLIVALLAMISLEIARLSVAELGIGLLPFTYVGVLVALANRIFWRARVPRLANVLYWAMLLAAMALKTAAEQEEQMGPDVRIKDVGTSGLYPTSDEVVDNAVMVGVELVLAILEFNGWSRMNWA